MWRKWNNYGNGRGPQIGQPMLLETTMEEGYLETIPEVDSLKSKRSSLNTTAPDQSIRIMAAIQSARQQHKEPPWSQPSPTIPDYYEDTYRHPLDDQYSEVSPISSPRRSHIDISNEDVPISPIESEGSVTERFPRSHQDQHGRIPRRIVSDKTKRVLQSSRVTEETRWDKYSGEPTKDESGLPSTIRPGVQPVEYQYPQLKERTKQILAGIREREAAARPGNGMTQPFPPTTQLNSTGEVALKEAKTGQSGRVGLVGFIQSDSLAAQSLGDHTQSTLEPVQELSSEDQTDVPDHALRTVASEESIKPIAPLKINTRSRNTSPQSSNGGVSPPFFDTIQSAPPVYQHSKSLQSPFSSPNPVKPLGKLSPTQYERPDSPPYDRAPATPRTPTPPAVYTATTPVKVQQMPNEPDVSRFSWTTYSTSVADSPNNVTRIVGGESPPPPMPQIPQLHIKKRLVGGTANEKPKILPITSPSQHSTVTRKPVGGKARPSLGASSQLSLSKTLPQIPPELEATDKIANLEAQLNALSMRKHNTNRIIRNLNDSLKRNAIIYDMWKRKDVTDKISKHELELQSIANEEHDVGLRLHRAQKKRDAADNYEIPTGLWIRRVTS